MDPGLRSAASRLAQHARGRGADRAAAGRAGRLRVEGPLGSDRRTGHGARRGGGDLRHAGDHRTRRGARWSRLRPVPDRLDRGQRGLPLQPNGGGGAVRHCEIFGGAALGRPAHPGAPGRVLVRRVHRGRRRVRHARRDHRGPARRTRLHTAVFGRPVAHCQHRAGGVRRDRHTDPDPRCDHRHPGKHAERDGRAAAAARVPHHSRVAGGDDERVARAAGRLAGGAGQRWVVRAGPVRVEQLRRPRAGRHRRRADLARQPRPAVCVVETGRGVGFSRPCRSAVCRRSGVVRRTARTGTRARGGAARDGRRIDRQGVDAVGRALGVRRRVGHGHGEVVPERRTRGGGIVPRERQGAGATSRPLAHIRRPRIAPDGVP